MFGTRNFYVYTPGFPRRQGRSNLLNMLVLGEFPKYRMIVEDGSVHMVHKRYRQYIVKVNYMYSGTNEVKIFYNKLEANEYVRLCAVKYISALIEYVIADWNKKLIIYGWYKNFRYTKVQPSISLPLLDSQDAIEQSLEHPLEEYLFNEYDTLSRIDDDSGIIWGLEGVDGEEDENENHQNIINEDVLIEFK